MEAVFVRQDESIVHESLETSLQGVLCFFGLGFGVRGKGGFRGVVVEVGGFDVLALLGAKDGGLSRDQFDTRSFYRVAVLPQEDNVR